MKSKYADLLRGRAQRVGAVLTSVCLLGGGAAFVLASSVNQAGAAASCGSSCFVAPGGNNTNAGTSGSPLQTIQAGVDAVSASGTVHVAAGTYDESVTIDHALTLSGANSGVAGTATRGAESLVERAASETGPVFDITTSAPVTIDGFNAQFHGTPSNGDILLSLGAANVLTFSDNLVNNSTYTNALLFDDSAASSTWHNNLFTNLTQSGSPGSGVLAPWGTIGGAQAAVTITGNMFSHLMDSDGVPAVNLNTVSGTVSANEFTDIHQYGILLAEKLGNLTISGNLFDQIHNDSPLTSGNRGSGIRTFQVPTFVGPVSITGNTFTNDYHGVRVANDGSPADLSSGFMTVNRNDFYADTQADISLASGTLGTLDGTCNWWGQSSGPAASQVDGSVTTSPFLSSGNLAGPCPATVPAAPHPVAAVPLNQAAKVNWMAQNDGGVPITGYVVTPYIGATAQPAHTFNSIGTAEVVAGLHNGTGYTFKIAAINSVGTGPQSPATGITIAGAPGKPGNPSVTNGTPGVLKVAFKAPMNDGAAITNFTATCTSSNGGVTRARSKAAGSPIGVNALTVGKHYTCTVFATNSRGKGPRSNPSAVKTA